MLVHGHGVQAHSLDTCSWMSAASWLQSSTAVSSMLPAGSSDFLCWLSCLLAFVLLVRKQGTALPANLGAFQRFALDDVHDAWRASCLTSWALYLLPFLSAAAFHSGCGRPLGRCCDPRASCTLLRDLGQPRRRLPLDGFGFLGDCSGMGLLQCLLAATSERCAAFQRSLSFCHEPAMGSSCDMGSLSFAFGMDSMVLSRAGFASFFKLDSSFAADSATCAWSSAWVAVAAHDGSLARLRGPFLVTALLRHCRFSVLPPDCRGIFLYLVRYVRQARRYKTWYEQNATPA